jgi:hypothetical protein
MNAFGLHPARRRLVNRDERQANGDVLVIGRAGDGIAIATLGKQVDPRSIGETLAVWCGMRLTVTVRKRELTAPHGVVDLASDNEASDGRFNGDPVVIPVCTGCHILRDVAGNSPLHGRRSDGVGTLPYRAVTDPTDERVAGCFSPRHLFTAKLPVATE